MNKKFIAYFKNNHTSLFNKFVKSEILVRAVSSLDFLRYVFCRITNKPYFGVYLMAGQTWEERKPYMENLLKREILNGKKEDFRLLEVGSWAGNSVLIWAEAIKQVGKKGEIVCVDPWIPYFKPEEIMPNKALSVMQTALKSNRIFQLFLHNINAANISNMTTIMRGTSDKVLPLLKERSFNMAFIDGSHYYSSVINDLKNAEKLVCDGGILCGDDLELQSYEVDIEFAEANKEIDLAFDPKTGKEYHPGVSLAIRDFFKGPVSYSKGFWAMRRTNNRWESVDLAIKDAHSTDYELISEPA